MSILQCPSVMVVAMHSHQWIYNVTFEPQRNLRVIVTENSRAVLEWVRSLPPNSSVIGISVQSEIGRSAGVLTLCTTDSCLVLRLRKNRYFLPEEFYQFLALRTRSFVGLDIGHDHEFSLTLANPMLRFGRLVNIRDYVRNGLVLSPDGFAHNVFGGMLNIDFPGIQYSDWRTQILTNDQIFYTVTRAYVCLTLASHNQSELQIGAANVIAAGGEAGAAAAQAQYDAAAKALHALAIAFALQGFQDGNDNP